jgi:endonuclease/exonuclease/phosphatase (EEP) superfamily protein YafD
MRTAVRLGNKSVAVFNIHLVPPYGVGRFRLQGRQVSDLLELVRAERGPVIVAGDFNFTSESRFAQAFSRLGLRDAHDLGGWGRGSTWPVNGLLRYITGIRIDHIFIGGGLRCVSSRPGTGEGSDHRPVHAVVGYE